MKPPFLPGAEELGSRSSRGGRIPGPTAAPMRPVPQDESLFKFARGGLPAFESPSFSLARKSITVAMSRVAIRGHASASSRDSARLLSPCPANSGARTASAGVAGRVRGPSPSLPLKRCSSTTTGESLPFLPGCRREFHFVVAGVPSLVSKGRFLLGAEVFFAAGSRLGGLPAGVLPVGRALRSSSGTAAIAADPRPNAAPEPPPKNRIRHRHGPGT